MPQFNRDLLREVFNELVKQDGFNSIDKFMIAGKEPFQLVLDHCMQASDVILFREKIVAKMPNIPYKTCYEYIGFDDGDYGQPVTGTTISTDMVLFKPISVAIASSLTSLDLYTFSPALVPMLKAVNQVMKKVRIQDSTGQLKAILDACVNIPFVEDGVTIKLCRNGYDFDYGMKSFAIPCHKLTIKEAHFNTMFQGLDLNNSLLHEIRDLTIHGSFNKTCTNEIKNFVKFLSQNFPNLEFLNVYFENKYYGSKFSWNWNDTEMAACFEALPPGIIGSICFKIFDFNYVEIDHAKYPDVEHSGFGEFYKVYHISDTLSYTIAHCEDEIDDDYNDDYKYDSSFDSDYS